MSAVDILFDLPNVLAEFAGRLMEVLTSEIEIFDITISLWQILAGASAAILLVILVFSIVSN